MSESQIESPPPAASESQPDAPQQRQSRVGRILLVMVPLSLAILAAGIAWGYYDVSGCISRWMLPPLVPVSGQVFMDGKPLEDAQIFTQAVNAKGRNALAKTDAAGRFALRTDVQGDFHDGVYVGEHRVMIIKHDPAAPTGPFNPPLLTPTDCAKFETTPLRLRVERDPARNRVEFRLESKTARGK
jgi:hypothetical protein